MYDHCAELGLEKGIFEEVYTAFVEMNLRRPAVKEGVLAKLDAVCQKINHVRYPEGFTWDDAKFKALVRIRIPLEEIKEEAKKEDDGEGEEEEQEEDIPPPTTPKEKPVNESKHDTTEGGDGERHPEWSKDTIPAQIIPAGEEKKWKEVTTKDEVLMLRTTGEEYNVYVLHQAAARYFRKEIANQLKRLNKKFEDIDPTELQAHAEEIANKAEALWIEHHAKELPMFDFPLN